jgi:small subunit ribosomal protein S1
VDFGAFVELESDIEGLIHISELTIDKIAAVEDFAKPGDRIKAEVISIDKDARKVGLSSKLVKLRESKADVDDYARKASATSKTSFGDVFADQLKNLKKD